MNLEFTAHISPSLRLRLRVRISSVEHSIFSIRKRVQEWEEGRMLLVFASFHPSLHLHVYWKSNTFQVLIWNEAGWAGVSFSPSALAYLAQVFASHLSRIHVLCNLTWPTPLRGYIFRGEGSGRVLWGYFGSYILLCFRNFSHKIKLHSLFVLIF